jgi:hypothetical protein
MGVSLAESCTPEQSDDPVDYAGQAWGGRFSSAETPQGNRQRKTARWNGISCAPPPGNGFRKVAAAGVSPCQYIHHAA